MEGEVLMSLMKRLVTEEEGQGLVEYSLILAVIAIAIILLGPTIKTAITTIWTKISGALTDASAD